MTLDDLLKQASQNHKTMTLLYEASKGLEARRMFLKGIIGASERILLEMKESADNADLINLQKQAMAFVFWSEDRLGEFNDMFPLSNTDEEDHLAVFNHFKELAV